VLDKVAYKTLNKTPNENCHTKLEGWKKYRNLVPRNFFELRVLQKIFQKIFQHFEITLFTQLTSYTTVLLYLHCTH
jgi:hypothetical protein